MIKTLILILCIAIGVSAQTPDEFKRSQERLTSELQNAKKESEALRREVAEAQARADSRVAALKKQTETEQVAHAEEIRRRGVEVARANEALSKCQAEVAERDREIAALKKNIKRRALLRILTFQW